MIKATKAAIAVSTVIILVTACQKRGPASPASGSQIASAATVAATTSPSAAPTTQPSNPPWGVTSSDTYTVARKKLIAAGFVPVIIVQAGAVFSDDVIKAYPEVSACTSGGQAICKFVFRAPDGQSYLTVQAGGEGDDPDPGQNMQVSALHRTTLSSPATPTGIDPQTLTDVGPDLLPKSPDSSGQ